MLKEQQESFTTSVFVLRVAAFCTLFGWALMHLFWDTSYRSFFWSEAQLSWLIHSFTDMSWTDYVTSSKTDAFIVYFGKSVGVILLLASTTLLLPKRLFAKTWLLLPIGSLILFFMYFLVFQENGFRLGNFFEHAAQIAVPTLAALAIRNSIDKSDLIFGLKCVTALTFLGHGLYAIGYYPVPGHFTDMVIEILRVNESTAKHILFLAGAIDVILVILLFIPKFDFFAAGYCIFWGFVTTMARPIWFVLLNINDSESLLHWLTQALYRAPHLLAPLGLLLLLQWCPSLRSSVAETKPVH